MRILLISGHGGGATGAVSKYGTEAEETRKLARLIKERLERYADVVLYPEERNAYLDNLNGLLQVNFCDFDYVFELHMNQSGPSGGGSGIEILVHESVRGVSVEELIVEKVSALGFTVRRDKGIFRTSGLLNMEICMLLGIPYALAETCFIDSAADMKIYREKMNEIADAYTEGLVEGFGLQEKLTYTPWSAKVVGADYLNVRRTPNGEILRLSLTTLPSIWVIGEEKDSDGDIWYKVRVAGSTVGYVWPRYISR